MRLPYSEPLVPLALAEPVIPEPPRRGEVGGEPCGICAGANTAVWSDDLWTLHPPVSGSLQGTVWLASRDHADSFCDLPPAAAERVAAALGTRGLTAAAGKAAAGNAWVQT